MAGMGLTSVSLSTGFIWACGADCASDPLLWTPANQPLLVFIAALAAWWGYLFAHYAWTGTLIDKSAHDDESAHDDNGQWENTTLRRLGVVFGASILVLGMVFGVIFIRQGNHLMTNIGGVLFLGGFVIAHHVETGNPL